VKHVERTKDIVQRKNLRSILHEQYCKCFALTVFFSDAPPYLDSAPAKLVKRIPVKNSTFVYVQEL